MLGAAIAGAAIATSLIEALIAKRMVSDRGGGDDAGRRLFFLKDTKGIDISTSSGVDIQKS